MQHIWAVKQYQQNAKSEIKPQLRSKVIIICLVSQFHTADVTGGMETKAF